ncbi:hypothetical protein CCACVL1_23213 [Corchorus capsularis]|uniref:Uncharacterized protein n=1 Tax=Corchorus capsularis TaxID=210143 RepID=A0A1R3GUV8_COCAP|nr:hypothetical protein CCACVL1_23213 [Corchorus capsularis]
MACERNLDKAKAAGKGSQLESNKKAISIQARENRFRITTRLRAARGNHAFRGIPISQVEVLDGVSTEVVNDQNEGDAVMNEGAAVRKGREEGDVES